MLNKCILEVGLGEHGRKGIEKMIQKILIANRGEIAVRIIRTCQKMNIKTVAVYSEADEKSLFVKLADESYLLGPPQVTESYLKADKIVDVAKKTAVDAIHPGYGFLRSEEHTSELQSRFDLVCRLLLEKKKE